MDADTDAIARTCWGEMRGAGHDAMVAVANIIINRVAKQTWFGITPLEVCMKHARLASGRVIYQFDCNDPNDPNCAKCQAVTMADPQFLDAMNIATAAILGTLPDTTSGATHYFSGDAVPEWAQGHTPCLTIGNTKWFNDIP